MRIYSLKESYFHLEMQNLSLLQENFEFINWWTKIQGTDWISRKHSVALHKTKINELSILHKDQTEFNSNWTGEKTSSSSYKLDIVSQLKYQNSNHRYFSQAKVQVNSLSSLDVNSDSSGLSLSDNYPFNCWSLKDLHRKLWLMD